MNKRTILGIVVILLGLFTILVGALRVKTGSGLRNSASSHLQHQRDTHATFHEEAAHISKQYQSSKIDQADWHSESGEAMARLKEKSEAAGAAWLDQLALASRKQRTGSTLLFIGTIALVVGVAIVLPLKQIAQQVGLSSGTSCRA